jgi:hypothetical protein
LLPLGRQLLAPLLVPGFHGVKFQFRQGLVDRPLELRVRGRRAVSSSKADQVSQSQISVAEI